MKFFMEYQTKGVAASRWADVPGHGMLLLHGNLSVSAPIQGLPPKAGNGLEHVCILIFSPPAHEAEHGDNTVNFSQPPSTTTRVPSTIL